MAANADISDPETEWKLVKKCLPFFCEKLHNVEVLVHLESRSLLRPQQIDEIKTENTSYEKNHKLLTLLPSCGSSSFAAFREILINTGQEHLLTHLFQEVKGPEHSVLSAATPAKKAKIISDTDANAEEIPAENKTEVFQPLLMDIYKTRFRRVHPFSLPFTFDIENTWVSLTLEKYKESDQNFRKYDCTRMEDHCQLISEAFQNKIPLLIIEGRAASGKTSLMRRIAYDWASGKLQQYDLVLIAAFRNMPKQNYNNILDLYLDGIQPELTQEERVQIQLVTESRIMKRILFLFDGFDETTAVCQELNEYLESNLVKPLLFDVIISSRPGLLSSYKKNHRSRLNFAEILGFDREQQQTAYINAHFFGDNEADSKVIQVQERLNENQNLRELAATPLFLTFICLVHEKLKSGTVFELYKCVIWWLLDRYQCDHLKYDIPSLFGFESKCNQPYKRTIQDHFLEFSLLKNLGRMALEIYPKVYFDAIHLSTYQITSIAHESGLLLKDEVRKEDWSIITQFLFPHRTIQEFLAGGVIYFWPDIGASREKLDHDISSWNEINKFIWNSVGTVSLNASLSQFFSLYTHLKLDLGLIDYEAEKFAMLLNTSLRSCSNVTNFSLSCGEDYDSSQKVLKEPVDQTEMRCLNALRLQNIVFEINPSAPSPIFKLNMTNDLQKVELDGLHFPSSSIFCATVEMLAKTTSSSTTLTLENVSIQLNKLEGLRKIKVSTKVDHRDYLSESEDSDDRAVNRRVQPKHKVSEFFAKEDRTFDEPEFVWTLKHLLCVHALRIFATKKSSGRYLKLPQLSFLIEIELSKFHFDIEEEMSSVFESQILSNVDVIKLYNCKFQTPLCFYMFMKHLFDQAKRKTWIDLALISVDIEKIEGIDNIMFEGVKCRICEFPQKFIEVGIHDDDDDNFHHNEIQELLSISSSTVHLYVTGPRPVTELLQSPISINLPSNEHLEHLHFENLNISKNALTIYLPKLSKLKTLRFEYCIFDVTSMEPILQCTRLNKLTFFRQRFGTFYDFDAFCLLLQNSGCACVLSVGILDITSVKMQKQSSTAHDATSVLCSLVGNMKTLKKFELCISKKSVDDYLIIDESKVLAAGAANMPDFNYRKDQLWSKTK